MLPDSYREKMLVTPSFVSAQEDGTSILVGAHKYDTAFSEQYRHAISSFTNVTPSGDEASARRGSTSTH